MVLLLAGLAAVPVDLRLHLERDGATASRVRIEWLFGWVGTTIERKGEPRPKERKPRSSPPLRELLEAWNAGLNQKTRTLLRRLRRFVHIHELRIRGRFGLADPADTGFALALLEALRGLFAAVPTLDVQVQPDFMAEGLSGEVDGALRVIPIGVLPALLAFGLSRPALRTLRVLRRGSA